MRRLEKALEIEDGSLSSVSKRAGVSRTALSLIRAGKYKANSEKVLRKVEEAYSGVRDGIVLCPALKDEISVVVCRKYAKAVKEKTPLFSMNFIAVQGVCPFCSHY